MLQFVELHKLTDDVTAEAEVKQFYFTLVYLNCVRISAVLLSTCCCVVHYHPPLRKFHAKLKTILQQQTIANQRL